MRRLNVHKRLQFSLRSVLAITLVFVLYFAYQLHLETKRRQQIQEIERAGGHVTYDDTISSLFPTSRLTGISFPCSAASTLDTSRFRLFANLCELTVTDGCVTDPDNLSTFKFGALRHPMKPGDDPSEFLSELKSVMIDEQNRTE